MAHQPTIDAHIAALLQEAGQERQGGELTRAQTLYHSILAMDSAQAVALNALGMMALDAQDPATAAGWFTRATEADPSAPPLWLNLATATRAQRDERGERYALEQALAIDRRHVMANYRIAELFERIGEEHRAFEHWQGLATMLAAVRNESPQLADILAQARARSAAYATMMTRELDGALASGCATHSDVDRRRVEACVDAMVGRRRIYANECHGVHFPFLPADEFFAREHFPWLAAIEAETDAIRAECQGLLASPDEGFQPYVTLAPGSPENLWTPLDGSTQWRSRHLWRHGKRIDDVCERCPRTAAAIDAIPRAHLAGRMPTAFFSILSPRTRLPAHTGVSNVRAIVHLPLIVPRGCGFRVGGETRAWRVGEAFVFDDTIEHEAWNDSDAVRAVLIFDVWNPHLTVPEQTMLQELFATMRSLGVGASNLVD
ncbi:aspartyl/asparaginyl beta-hydroxylase domain-containing protein [Sphingomonas oligophenolica]|uniref:Aspartyl/asparaginy/proline hydroxylase domain-containing protein n=1 Tax=Sphingomonas oligophenolica TaxID=301154 RepID=A0A502CCB9_9SPHN|nr:aspartyl/asparaginyl beta-hydroxylase domain-containing protein [Sphingomonas oligophenolica]TPG10797.1 hypothetical protein EAH84_11970 [Sphingomonas oligophenolica]